MSFDLAVWAAPAPVTAHEADAEHERLWAASAVVDVDAVHPAVAAFHRALTDLHPDLAVDMTLTESAVLMTIAWSRAEEIAPLVEALAVRHGLTCYDPQRPAVRSPVGPALSPVLTQCDGTTWTDPDPVRIDLALRRLDAENWFAVLERADGHYIQVGHGERVNLEPGRYVVEYREGGPETHHRAEVAEIGAVVSAFQRFARSDGAWRDGIGWARYDP